MRKMFKSLVILVLLVSLSGCKVGIFNELKNLDNFEIIEEDTVYLEFFEDTLSPFGFEYCINNFTKNDMIYEEPYYIQQNIGNNWENLEPKNEMNFDAVGYTLEANQSVIKEMDWSIRYGKLEPGKYRFYKEIFEYDAVEGTEIYVEFEIK